MPPKRDWDLRVADIMESIAKIQGYIEGMDFESFAWDERTVDAVLRHFGVIGEAPITCPNPSRPKIRAFPSTP